MRGWFKRRPRPAVQQPPKPQGWDDRAYAAAHGLTLHEWAALTPTQQRDARLGVVAALNERNAA